MSKVSSFPPRDDIEPRSKAKFSSSQRFHIRLRQSTDGISRCDGPKCEEVLAILSPDGHWIVQTPHEFDHGHARALGGRTHTENGRALCVPCHRLKTNEDLAILAKASAQGGREGSQYFRRQQRKARGERGMQGKGFPK